MATACTYCGQDLPRDDARFCNSCGMLVPSHPFSSQSLSASTPDSSQMGREYQKPMLREQRAQQPVAKPILREQRAQQPQSRPRSTRRIAPDDLVTSSIAWPTPITHVSTKEPLSQKDGESGVSTESAESAVQEEQQRIQNVPSQPLSSKRELRVKIWEHERNNPPTPLPESKSDAPYIKHTPTPIWVTSTLNTVENVHSSTQNEMDEWRDEVEHADTVPTSNYAQMPSPASQLLTQTPYSIPGNTPLPIEQQHSTNIPSTYLEVSQRPTSMPSVFPLQPSQQAHVPVQNKRIRGATSITSHVVQRSKSRVPFVLLLAFLCILILGGGVWVVLAQPFSVPSITQPLQDFKDTQLSIDLSYPSSWSVRRNATGVLFSDSSHTAQMQLAVTNAKEDVTHYVQQQAIKSGMTAIQPLGTRSFASATWQQVQGNMQQNGVNYTTTMLATVHGNRTYVLMQMAPQNVYTDEESVVFSAVRNSFKFL